MFNYPKTTRIMDLSPPIIFEDIDFTFQVLWDPSPKDIKALPAEEYKFYIPIITGPIDTVGDFTKIKRNDVIRPIYISENRISNRLRFEKHLIKLHEDMVNKKCPEKF